MQLGAQLAEARKELGMTQSELAEQIHVTRQTVSRWESGTVYPDIEKIAELADILNVSCDYLLKNSEKAPIKPMTQSGSLTRLLSNLKDKNVKITFYDDEEDYDIIGKECHINGFEGNWMQVEVISRKGNMQKLIAISSILSVEILNGKQEV